MTARPQIVAALLSALLLFMAFRPLRLFPCAWIALIPVLRAAQGQPSRERFRLGALFGFVAFTAMFYWIPVTIFNGRWLIPLGVAPGVLLALLAWTATGAVFALGCGLILTVGLTDLPPTSFTPLRLACVWFVWEWLRTQGALGFEGGTLALSQRPWLTLVQNVDLIGLHGVSWIIALTNASLAFAPVTKRSLAIALALVALGWLRGRWWKPTLEIVGTSKVALIQPFIPSREKVSAKRFPVNLPMLKELTARAAGTGSELVLWPETMIPRSWTLSPEIRSELQQLVSQLDTEVLIGTNERETKEGPLFNQAVLLAPDGERGRVRKRRLVIFGEYVPLKRYLPFLRWLSPGNNDYHPGSVSAPLNSRGGRFGVLVCFESTFSAEAKRLARAGAEFLVVVTNDDWFRGTTAIADHTDWAVLRALETRRWIVQAANTGESVFIDPHGHIVRRLPLDQRAVLAHRVERLTTLTPAVRFGPVFPWLGVMVTFWLIGHGARPRSDCDGLAS